MVGPVQARQEQQVRHSRHKGSPRYRLTGLSHAFVSISRGGFCQIGCKLSSPRDGDPHSRRSEHRSSSEPYLAVNRAVRDEHASAKAPCRHFRESGRKRGREKGHRTVERGGQTPSGHKIAGGKSPCLSRAGSNRFDSLRLKAQWFLTHRSSTSAFIRDKQRSGGFYLWIIAPLRRYNGVTLFRGASIPRKVDVTDGKRLRDARSKITDILLDNFERKRRREYLM